MEEFFLDYANFLFKICLMYTKSKEDAEDAIQYAFMKYIEKQPQFINEAHRRNWFIKVAINYCKNILNAFWRKHTVKMDLFKELYVDDEVNIEILIDLFKLPVIYREVLYLYYYEGYKINEISQLLNKKESTITNRLSRARKTMKLKMEEMENEDKTNVNSSN